MLDTETKRRIDTARDLLVGKVPDPKSQVEQITIALIYKFMDDMDAEAEELGGKRKFFSGEYEKFGWSRLMKPGIGGHELLALYADGIAKMPENPGIPPLFRDIFKNAYLPYRDPETLKSFLKVINDFTYDHSERLGDAFEYLLSVLGSQGDAGQFRTPRHIIDFIVDILAPRSDERILDPACGTAGFLISAYKHILRSNTDAKGHSTLTPQQRGAMARNFQGYDISPDMVRLSLVNLYLHGFTDPHIFEYDTLTDTARWNEQADVILANPPFMSPKGGIRPHNRFSIQAKRSEVLFVDYIAEHLGVNGRAGIIVPEGIIFQSQNAYKDLRKMLVENSLVAVISLPAGCFNPYSGVKTSILLLDKSLARQSDTVAFFKVENDGYDLGAQRRPIQKNDLPTVRTELENYLTTLREGKDPSSLTLTTALIVPKEKIVANGDYNLSGERYRESSERETHFQKVSLGELLNLEFGTRITKKDNEGTLYPVYGGGGESFRTDTFTRENDVVVSRFAMSPECVREVSGKFYLLDSGFTFLISEEFSEKASKHFVAQVLLNTQSRVYGCARGHAQKNIDTDAFRALEIPLPPLEIQREIVAEIEGYQKVINGARAILDNYRPHIPINPAWPMGTFRDVISTITPPKKIQTSGFQKTGRWPVIDQSQDEIAGRTDDESALIDGSAGLIIFGDHTCAVKYVAESFAQGADGIKILTPKEGLLPKFVYFYLLSHPIESDGYKRHFSKLKESQIPLPPLAEQQAIVAEIEAEQNLVNANLELITRFENKIQTTLSRIWGEDSASTEA